MVSNSKDDHPSKATPVTNTGVTTHPVTTIATRDFLNPPSQLHTSVWEKIKPANGLFKYTVWCGSLLDCIYDLLLLPLGPVYYAIAIGASLSEPHTNRTAMCMVCVYACLLTINFKWSYFNIWMSTCTLAQSRTRDYCAVSAWKRTQEWRWLKLKLSQLLIMTDKADYSQVAEILQGG